MRGAALAVLAGLLGVVAGAGLGRAAINPASPGLAEADAYGQTKIRNNGASALCVECHTVAPLRGAGTHFVVNAVSGALRRTSSGGGWTGSAWGAREGGEFFKLTPWVVDTEWGSGGSSKYGDTATWESVVFAAPEGVVGAEAARTETAAATMATYEVICESCHSLRVNVEGRYNLLAKVTDSTTVDDMVEGRTAPLCVGCHGFLYQNDPANVIQMNWADPRNIEALSGVRRGNNERHWVRGTAYPRNHHVMSGDAIDTPVVEARLTFRDVEVLSPSLLSVPIRTDSRKGTMPIRPVPLLPIVRPSDPLNLHCVTCHAPGHGGDRSLGAGILRGAGLSGRDAGWGIDRIADGREWGRYLDIKFCGCCHE